MSAELDMSQYLGLFLQEAEEQLEILEQETLKLEEDPSMDRLQIIFRAAHTIKGSSRAMGFQNFAELTHEMENVLDQLRNGVIQVTSEIADALLQTIDTLKQMTDAINNGNGDVIECAPLVAALQVFGNPSGAPVQVHTPEPTVVAEEVAVAPAAPVAVQSVATHKGVALTHEQTLMLNEAKQTGAVYHGYFELAPDCVMKFVRAFMVVSAVQAAGEILLSIPDGEALEEEKFEHAFELYFMYSGDFEELQVQVAGISELAVSEITEWSETAAAQEAEEPVALELVTNEVAPEPVAQDVVAPVAATPAPAAPVAAKPSETGKKADTGQTVRVDVARLDNLMNLVGELVIDRTRIAQIGNELGQKYRDNNVDALTETVGHIARITSDLQDQIMKARMLMIETVFNRFPRVVRDLAQKLGKEVKLDIHGGDTELDRSVIEIIGDPLLHILRNAVDHGMEMPEAREAAGKPRIGSVVVAAKHQENHIVIEISDDGKGIDTEKVKAKAVTNGLITKDAAERMSDKEALQLIFASGLSTATEVSEVSGRGVGMDIVRSNIIKVGGIIDIDSAVGVGSKFSLRIPLTLAIIRGLLVNSADNVYVVPLGSVVETLRVTPQEIQTVKGAEVIIIRGVTTPLIYLNRVFSQPERVDKSADAFVVIVGLAEQRVGIVVDNLIGEQEVVIKSLSRFCGDVQGVSGATILGDGNVALILDVNALLESK